MRSGIILLLILMNGFSLLSQDPGKKDPGGNRVDNILLGEWVRFSPMGPIRLNFKTDGLVEGDLGDDKTVDIVSQYSIDGDMVKFMDKQGVTCPHPGVYKIHTSEYYVSFDLAEDNCGGRVKSTMGFWVRPDFMGLIKKLSDEITASPDPDAYLNRARIFMAIGKSFEARQDFNQYVLHDSTVARVYVNRAGTRFPADMQGVVEDCNIAISIDPAGKNAYFLRGLALYEMGERKKACDDFHTAIELGFTILKEAEKARCSEYWESYTEK